MRLERGELSGRQVAGAHRRQVTPRMSDTTTTGRVTRPPIRLLNNLTPAGGDHREQ
jgi:hypothetical protein